MGIDICYVPFLKAKQNEIRALSNLDEEVSIRVRPFFDVPRPQRDVTPEKILKGIESAKANLGRDDSFTKRPFYVDVYDVPAGIRIEGEHSYDLLLDELEDFPVIPVLGFDREEEHNEAVYRRADQYAVVAIRLLEDDLVNSTITLEFIGEVMEEFEDDVLFDIIFDFRLIEEGYDKYLSSKSSKFLCQLEDVDNIRDVIITASSIPPVVTELATPNKKEWFERFHWKLWNGVENDTSLNQVYGDYTVVSPQYSDVDIPTYALRKVQTPKVIYTEREHGFITRGGSLNTQGDDQYFDLASHVLSCGIYRGENFSYGDKYIFDVANRKLSKKVRGNKVFQCGGASKWIEVTVNCHISMIVGELS